MPVHPPGGGEAGDMGEESREQVEGWVGWGGEGRTGTEEGGTTTKRWETKDGRMKECECGGGEKIRRERQKRREEENQGKKINE